MTDVDVAIVGGGPAGLSTALFLANAHPRLRARIVVLEKKAYPRDKYCAGAVGARADELLASIGTRVEVPSVAIAGMSVRTEQGTARERLATVGRVVRRIEFDHELCRVARAKGIHIEENACVTDVAIDRSGVTLRTPQGQLRARAIVGADGVGSFVRRAAGLSGGELMAQVVELDTEPVASDLARDILHFDIADRSFTGYSWDFPTLVDGKPMVCRGIYHLKLDDRPVDLCAILERRLAAQGLDIGRYKLKRYAEHGFQPQRAVATPRVLLVGEASGIDGLTGEGIAQAVEYAALAGPYLAEKVAANDYFFGDWPAHISGSKLGFDLRLRHRLLSYYTGRYRSWFERHLLLTPEYIACGLERFAGRPVNARRLIRPMMSAAWAFVTSRQESSPAPAIRASDPGAG